VTSAKQEKVKRSVRAIRFCQACQAPPANHARQDHLHLQCHDSGARACGDCINWYGIHTAGVAVQSKQFQHFLPPMLSNGWCLTAFGTRYSLRLIKPLCRERVSRKTCHSPHFTRLVGVCRSADQALGGASSCLMHANRLGARDTSHGAHRTAGAMMHMA